MKAYLILFILFAVLIGFSCEKDDFIFKQENDTIVYVAFNPNMLIIKNKPYELEITKDKESDLLFKIMAGDFTLDGITHKNSEANMYPLNEAIKLSWGGVGSSFLYFIKNGDKINEGSVMWEDYPDGMTLLGNSFGYSSGVWASQQLSDGYIGIKLAENDQSRYGWIHLAVTDTSLTLKEYALSKIANQSIIAGLKP